MNEEISVPCAHCSGRVNLDIEEHCPKCKISIFLSPNEAFNMLLLPYDLKKAKEITETGKKYLQQLLELQLSFEKKVHSWTDKSVPKTNLELEVSRVNNKIKWSEIFEKYVSESSDLENTNVLPLTEWLTLNYVAPNKRK